MTENFQDNFGTYKVNYSLFNRSDPDVNKLIRATSFLCYFK